MNSLRLPFHTLSWKKNCEKKDAGYNIQVTGYKIQVTRSRFQYFPMHPAPCILYHFLLIFSFSNCLKWKISSLVLLPLFCTSNNIRMLLYILYIFTRDITIDN